MRLVRIITTVVLAAALAVTGCASRTADQTAAPASSAPSGTEFFAPNQPVDYRNVFEGTEVYTNPQNGATVVSHVAAQLSDTIISGDPEGVSTHEIRFIGLTRLLRTADGDVLVGGAGYLVLHQVINADGEVISTEIIVDRGPHPIAESDFALFCDFMTDALGLS
jgi:hypothetical protein